MNAREKFGLPVDAGVKDVKTHWRYRCKMLHPDYGGDGVEFHEQRVLYEAALKEANEPAKPVKCRGCKGTGRVQMQKGFFTSSMMCELCRGSGVYKNG